MNDNYYQSQSTIGNIENTISASAAVGGRGTDETINYN